MKISNELKQLASLFSEPLYVVGGAVRDHLIGYEVHDYDLASSIRAEEVVEMLKGTPFTTTPHSLKLGTLGIKVGDEVVEYTAFRKDSYSCSGVHSPEKVEFDCSIEEDARRRDFTINAVYYDIKKECYVDPLNGIEDLKIGVIKTTREPGKVLEEDALRLLRLVRFSASLGFKIDKETYREAKLRADTIKEIATERIRDEFNKILVSDTVNGIKDAQIEGIKLMVDLGIMEYVVPEILEGIGVKQNPRYHVYDVYNHILETVRVVPPRLRLVAFLHDVGKPRSVTEEGRMQDHAPIGAGMTRVIMNRLLYPHRETERTVRMVENHMFNIKCNLPDDVISAFIIKNADILDDLLELKKADYTAHGMNDDVSPAALKIIEVYENMLKNKVAFTVKDLPIGGRELIELGVSPEERGELLNSLLTYGAYLGRGLTKEECLSYVKCR